MSAEFNQDRVILICATLIIDKDGAELQFLYHLCLSSQNTPASQY